MFRTLLTGCLSPFNAESSKLILNFLFSIPTTPAPGCTSTAGCDPPQAVCRLQRHRWRKNRHCLGLCTRGRQRTSLFGTIDRRSNWTSLVASANHVTACQCQVQFVSTNHKRPSSEKAGQSNDVMKRHC